MQSHPMYKDGGIFWEGCGSGGGRGSGFMASLGMSPSTHMQEGLQISETEGGGMCAHCVCCACVKAACASNGSK